MRDPERIYNTKAWRDVRRFVLRRDGYLCRVCGAKAEAVDHIVAWREGGAWFDPENLRAICQHCNSSRVRRDRRPEASGQRRPSREW